MDRLTIFAFTDPNSGQASVRIVSYVTKEKPKKSNFVTLHNDHRFEKLMEYESEINLFCRETQGGSLKLPLRAKNKKEKEIAQNRMAKAPPF